MHFKVHILIIISLIFIISCEATIDRAVSKLGTGFAQILSMRSAPAIPPIISISYRIENGTWPYAKNEYSQLHKKIEPSELALPICNMEIKELGTNYYSMDYSFFVDGDENSDCARPFSVKIAQLDTEEECYEITDYTVIGEVFDKNGTRYTFDKIESNLKEPICASNKSLNNGTAQSTAP